MLVRKDTAINEKEFTMKLSRHFHLPRYKLKVTLSGWIAGLPLMSRARRQARCSSRFRRVKMNYGINV